MKETVISHQKDLFKKKHSLIFFILFPALSMLLGWGLRGFIGGGPYGAMVPGAMVILAICMLLDVPLRIAIIAVVFGTAGTAMGGEMTYGQTIGFLRNSNTIWWGFTGTSIKGGVWGLVSGAFIGLGLVHRQLKLKTIITGLLIFLVGFVIGVKIINDPKLLYFSDPFNHPRNESWAGLLFAAISLLGYLKIKAAANDFRIVARFAFYGLIGGALGFGLGSLWITVGAKYGAHFFIIDWWKMMEFSFGLLLGGFLGYAAWQSRNENMSVGLNIPMQINRSFTKELMVTVVLGLFIYGAVPLFEQYIETVPKSSGLFYGALATLTRVIVNYTFIGSLLIIIVLRLPYLGFQIAVTLTFCHTMIDLVTDEKLFPQLQSSSLLSVLLLAGSSLFISLLVAIFQRKKFILKSMFLILVWSTIIVAVIRTIAQGEFNFLPGHSFAQIFIGDMFVFNVFIISAIVSSLMVIKNKSLYTPFNEHIF